MEIVGNMKSSPKMHFIYVTLRIQALTGTYNYCFFYHQRNFLFFMDTNSDFCHEDES